MLLCPSCQAENDDVAQVCFTCRTILSAVTRGTVIGSRYEILSPLGKGGMGAVYKARDRVLDEVVALKLLRADVAGSSEMAERFRSEIRLARRVSHWNVCRIHEYGADGPLQYISMELVEGTHLKALLEGGPLPTAQAFDVALQIADGLQAIHKSGIVHRDLKPLNIMVDAHGVVRIMDFGIAKRLFREGASEPRASSYVMGTPEYMSPEQARGQKVDFRSDVYALGVVVYETFTGRVPFRSDAPVGTLLMHLESVPPLEGTEAAAIPGPLVPVLRKALSKEPSERYASAAELAGALNSARDAIVGPPAAAATARPAHRPRRIRLPMLLGGLAFLGIGAIVVALRTHPPGEPGPLETPLPATPPPTRAAPASTPPMPTERTKPSTEAGLRRSGPPPSPSPPAAPAGEGPSPVPATPTPQPPATSGPETSSPPSATPAPASAPSEAPDPSPAPVADVRGGLLVVVSPWASVSVDGRALGDTPLGRIQLDAGRHDVLLVHPHFEPFHRRVTVRPRETLRLVVDLDIEGVRRPR
ncbi:MAG TPA: protein kinase [Vicinamibacteria bacterium]|jgi:serine/threonine protein kinase|nr:protein kinase [Vicinamibacteria bacterium]